MNSLLPPFSLDLNGREQGLFAGLLLSLDAQEKNLLSDLTTIKQQQQQAQ